MTRLATALLLATLATGLAGFLACMADPAAGAHLELGQASRILVFNSEGATAPAIYEAIVGRKPDEMTA